MSAPVTPLTREQWERIRQWVATAGTRKRTSIYTAELAALLDVIKAGHALVGAVRDHRDHACTMPHLALDAALSAYVALTETPE